MNIFKNKIFIKIIASLCIVLTLMNMGIPHNAFAEDIYGGILIIPVTNLLVSICDGVIGLLHKTIQYQDITLVEISGEPNWWKNFGKYAVAALVTIGIIAIAGVYFLPTLAAAAGTVAKLSVIFKAVTTVGMIQFATVQITGEGILHVGTFVVEKLGDWFSGTLYMPVYSLTPRYIFSNQIRLFDINFFDPMEPETVIVDEQVKTVDNDKVQVYYDIEENIVKDGLWADGIASATKLKDDIVTGSQANEYKNKILINEMSALDVTKTYSLKEIYDKLSENNKSYLATIISDINTKLEETGDHAIPEDAANTITVDWRKDEWGEDANLYNCVKIGLTKGTADTPKELIIIISTVLEKNTVQIEKTLYSSAEQLKGVVSTWYYRLRNLAIIMMLIILLYSGIRIVIGSTAGQKAKYKERIQDWLVAMCLLFVMQYIMVFAIEICNKISDLLISTKLEAGINEEIPLKKEHIQSLNELSENEVSEEYQAFKQLGTIEGNNLKWLTDVMGKFRIWTQATEEGTIKWAGYAMCFILLTIYTVFFSWTYLKRVLQMAFLTVIAPMVAMTYPLDKINDGKAQAFSMWIKEYIFNLLIQPMHLLLYTILVTSAYKLVVTNAIYSIVALGFIMPAEQLIRKFFGFTKSQTAGALGGAAGAALAYSGLQNITKFTKKFGGKGDNNKDDKEKDPKFKGVGIKKHEVVADNMLGSGEHESPSTPGAAGGAGAARLHGAPGGVETPPAETPPAETPPVETPPVETPPVETPPVETPPAETLPVNNSDDKNSKGGESKKKIKKTPMEKIAGVARATSGVGRTYTRQLGAKMGKRIRKQRPIRALARGVAGIYGAAAMGLAGAALGIASGDPNKAFQYGTAAAVGGFGAGKALGGSAVDALAVDTEKVWDEIKTTYYGSDYKKKKLEKELKNMSNNEKNLWEIRQYLPDMSEKDARDMLAGDVGRRCYESGITDMKDIAAVYAASRNGQMSIDEGIAGLKFSSQFPSKLKEMGQEERDNMVARWTKEYEELKAKDPEKYKDLDPAAAAQRSLDLAEEINKIKSGLTDVPK